MSTENLLTDFFRSEKAFMEKGRLLANSFYMTQNRFFVFFEEEIFSLQFFLVEKRRSVYRAFACSGEEKIIFLFLFCVIVL